MPGQRRCFGRRPAGEQSCRIFRLYLGLTLDGYFKHMWKYQQNRSSKQFVQSTGHICQAEHRNPTLNDQENGKSRYLTLNITPETSANHLHNKTIVDATIAELQDALSTGTLSSVELVAKHLHRIAQYDRRGPLLNAIPVLNTNVFQDAQASDEKRATAGGSTRSPLEGIPVTIKDSYKIKGMTVAAGSPAFQNLVATEDSFVVSQIKNGGGIIMGRTNMPPMAAGGMQRGVYGRAESPYNGEYLTAAFASGSSNGSATATAANFGVIGMGEETISLGRSPASNNPLVAYTPSRGLISIRGNWPLFSNCDTVVPHTRLVRDMMTLLNLIVAPGPCQEGRFLARAALCPADARRGREA